MTPENLPGLTVTAEQLGPVWTPLQDRRLAPLATPTPRPPRTITKLAA